MRALPPNVVRLRACHTNYVAAARTCVRLRPFWANPFLANPFLANVCVLVVSQSVRPRRVGAPKGWGGQNFALFFPLSRPIFALFVFLWGSSRGIFCGV